ncbi:GNAT family N-acetyltransferase [Streptomyces spectabilis]|uniref:N-acetyltransferase n=1 Tax=Streptomyces spectabilis TaxID=68270 RepID=A0A5P2XHU3_STRST|nr:GNAT family protein [Streptomyces spectabilis]MBB5106914.1 ribosomal-protein-alanine N-acetyltransferase [Streptomyces spectabilis]MCI3906356.1 GNAT family N-acetyltransferase [Streptomyces spectabilis]QEV63214.1 N-acetyltransferase [Streptomyces spectabilis]GGV41184.1 ribosomal-protein-alanine N-acetyltransferase [Streptomyces spectabilis]
MELRTVRLTDDIVLRPSTTADAAALARAYDRSRAHLGPWDPERPPEFFTTAGQLALLRAYEQERAQGLRARWLLWDESGARAGEEAVVAGGIALSHIVGGPLRSADLGYWIDSVYTGRGLATAAVTAVCAAADADLRLHRLEAGTLPHNAASQRVLAKCGFTEYGLAPSYLHINGAWQDHRLFQVILNDREP